MSTPRSRPQVPSRLDLKALEQLTEPLTVKVYRTRQGAPSEEVSVNLQDRGVGWARSDVLELEQRVVTVVGGGIFHATVYDSQGRTLEYQFFSPARSVIPAGPRVAAEYAEANARAAQAQAAMSLGMAPTGAQPIVPQGAPFSPPAGWGAPPPPAWSAQQVSMPQPQAPFGQAPWWGTLPPQPQPQPPPPYGQPYGSPPPQPWPQYPYAQQQLPPQIPPTPVVGQTDPTVLAKLQALEAQNAQLREAEIRREANAGVMAMMQEMRQFQQQSELRTQQMFEKFMSMATSGRPNEEMQRRLDEEARARREAELRAEHARQVDALRIEMQRVADQSRQNEERFRSEMAGARESNNSTLMQQLIANQQQSQQQSQQQMLALLQQANQRDRPADMIALARSMAPTQDPTAQKIMEVAIDRLVNPGDGGGAPSTAQVIGDIGRTVLQEGSKIVRSIADAGARKEEAQAQAQARISQRAAAAAERARQVVVAPQPALNGANGVAGANGVHVEEAPAAAEPPPVQYDALGEPIPPDPLAGAAGTNPAQVEDDRRYFGDAFSQVEKLREHVIAGNVKAEDVARVLCEAWTYFTNMQVQVPAMADIGAWKDRERTMFAPGNHMRIVTRVLPGIAADFRKAVVDALPAAINQLILGNDEAEEDEAEEETT